MPVTCLVGLQWGDEGKGKIVDYLSREADYVVRYQGGSNAGHTVVIHGKKYVLHLVPSGIFYPTPTCVLGNGMVIHLERLNDEIDQLSREGISVEGRLWISDRAHVVLPLHGREDRSESSQMLGTTAQGIGPCYQDKYARVGVRLIDLFSPHLQSKLQALYQFKKEPFTDEALARERDQLLTQAERLRPFIVDTHPLLNQAVHNNKNIFLEGAQGTLLDVDFGTYPWVTSSHASLLGAPAGTGLSPRKINHVIGVLKAYTTRVGQGPFPTECLDGTGHVLRDKGIEFGATTGRPRRCGWLDLVALTYAVQLNDVDQLAITKLDVLSGLKEIRIAMEYQSPQGRLTAFPSSADVLLECQPVYQTLPGWSENLQDVERIQDLPPPAQQYLNFIENHLQKPIVLVSVGADRKRILLRT